MSDTTPAGEPGTSPPWATARRLDPSHTRPDHEEPRRELVDGAMSALPDVLAGMENETIPGGRPEPGQTLVMYDRLTRKLEAAGQPLVAVEWAIYHLVERERLVAWCN